MNTHPPYAGAEPEAITRQQWKWSALAGMASYLDAGSIVALGAGLAIFQSYLNLSDKAIGALAAIGPNAIGCAIGALGGGWLGDKLGRKTIYQYDLIVYALGILCIALAINQTMLFLGTFVWVSRWAWISRPHWPWSASWRPPNRAENFLDLRRSPGVSVP